MHASLTRPLLLCVLIGPAWSSTAEPAKKPSSPARALHKHNQPEDDAPDEDKPATKKPAEDKEPASKKDETAPPSASYPAAVSSLNPAELTGFSEYPKQVMSLVESSLALTHLALPYTFGGTSPGDGGMDCSGTIYHVLRFQGLKDVPRQSDEMCAWVRDHSQLHLTPTPATLDDNAFSALHPGDLVFWTGTYKTDRKLPITHVMLYLGKLKKTGKPVVFGASDGRYYAGERRSGVSVFDLSVPREGSEAALYGYGPVPGLVSPEHPDEVARSEPASSQTKPPEAGTIKPAIVKGDDSSAKKPFAKDQEDKPSATKKKSTASQEDDPTPPKKPKRRKRPSHE